MLGEDDSDEDEDGAGEGGLFLTSIAKNRVGQGGETFCEVTHTHTHTHTHSISLLKH